MAISKGMNDWDQTALLWSTISNTARDPKKRRKPYMPEEVHPLWHFKPPEQKRHVREAIREYQLKNGSK